MDENKDQTGQEVTTPDTTPTEDKQPEYSEIHDKDISELLNGDDFDEAPKEDETPEEETTPEVKEPDPAEDTQPKTDPEPEKEDKTPPTPEEKLILDTDELSDKAADKIIQRLLDKTDKTKEEKKDILADAPWKKENRTPTWEEAMNYVYEAATDRAVSRVKEELNQEIQAEEAREKEQQEAIATQQKQRAEYLNKTWDDQLLNLEKTGKIPPIVNAESKDDPGMKARLALYQKVKEVKDAKEAQGLPVTETDLSLELAYYRNPDAVKIAQPAGGDAPVAGGGKTVTKPNADSFTYQELKGDWEDILTE